MVRITLVSSTLPSLRPKRSRLVIDGTEQWFVCSSVSVNSNSSPCHPGWRSAGTVPEFQPWSLQSSTRSSNRAEIDSSSCRRFTTSVQTILRCLHYQQTVRILVIIRIHINILIICVTLFSLVFFYCSIGFCYCLFTSGFFLCSSDCLFVCFTSSNVTLPNNNDNVVWF